MKIMKITIILAAAFTFSSTVFAADQDLQTYDTLVGVGAQSESFMAQDHVGVTGIECMYSNISYESSCTMHDIAANGGQGADVTLSDKDAVTMMDLIGKLGAQSDNGMGKVYLELAGIQCKQVSQKVSGDSEPERTLCQIQK